MSAPRILNTTPIGPPSISDMPERDRIASAEAINLWSAACKLRDAGPRGVDYGLLLLVRDKVDAMLDGWATGADLTRAEGGAA